MRRGVLIQITRGFAGFPNACCPRAPLHYILLLAPDSRDLEFVETTLERASRRDLILLHEPALAGGLLVLQACRVQLILVNPALCDGRLEDSVSALRLLSSGAPIVLLERRGSGRRLLIRLPGGVRAIVGQSDAAGLLRTVEALLGPEGRADT